MREVLDLMAANDLDAAIALLEKNRNAKATAAYDFMLGNLRFTRDELDLAALAYGTAAAKYPNYRRAWQQLGLARVQLGQFDKARDALVRAFELGADDYVTKPFSPRELCLRVKAILRRGRPSEAAPEQLTPAARAHSVVALCRPAGAA